MQNDSGNNFRINKLTLKNETQDLNSFKTLSPDNSNHKSSYILKAESSRKGLLCNAETQTRVSVRGVQLHPLILSKSSLVNFAKVIRF